MRLIDADNLNFEGQHYNKSQMKAILDFVDSQPTAYDVDAAVEQLDEYITKIVGRKSALYQTVMQIVKGGGVDAKANS